MLRIARTVASMAAAALLAGCVSSPAQPAADGSQGPESPEQRSLVVAHAFDLRTTDPARLDGPTGRLIDRAVYDTLLTYDRGDITRPVPGLAVLRVSRDARTFVLTLTGERTFSDGSPVTADDVVFSLRRAQALGGPAAGLLEGVTVTRRDARTVALTTTAPAPQLPAALTSPSLSILNMKAVRAQGGRADARDRAGGWLDTSSAGSGPYVIESVDAASQVVLRRNARYDGPEQQVFDTIVLRNADGAAQKDALGSGEADVALDLSAAQAAELGDTAQVVTGASATTVYLLLNQNRKVSPVTADPRVVQAVKLALDYPSFVEAAGQGSQQATSVIPTMLAGSLDPSLAPQTNPVAASALYREAGRKGSVRLSYPSDVAVGGVRLEDLAQRIKAQLEPIGLTVELAPEPVATARKAHRAGKEHMGLWYWAPESPDPASCLVFAPGGLLGRRAGWSPSMDIANAGLADRARAAVDDERVAAYQAFAGGINESGPFVPLVQPAGTIAAAQGITGLDYNPVWTLDLADVGRA